MLAIAIDLELLGGLNKALKDLTNGTRVPAGSEVSSIK